MGGYGALRWALSYPQKFAAVAALSPVTDLSKFRTDQVAIMPDMDRVFDPTTLRGTPVDIAYLVDNSDPAASRLRLLMTTGTQDLLHDMDVASHQPFTAKFGDRFSWYELPGHHDWPLWNQQLPSVMNWLVKGSFRENRP